MTWVSRPYHQLHWQKWPTAHTSDLVYFNSFVAYSCYLSINSNDIHIATFILPLVRGKYLYNDATFCIQKCTRTSKISIYPSKRQKHCFDYKLCKFQMLYRKGQKASIEISIYPVTLRLIQKLFTETVHGNFHVSCNIETNFYL